VFEFKVGNSAFESLSFTVIPSRGKVDMYVLDEEVGEEPSPDATEIVTTTMGGGKICEISNPAKGSRYRAGVVASEDAEFTITASTSEGVVELQASVPVHGEVDMEKFQYYKIFVNNGTELMNI
jgi:hypothetical protein